MDSARIGVYVTQLQFGGLLPDHRHLQGSILHSQRVSRRITGTECKEILQFSDCSELNIGIVYFICRWDKWALAERTIIWGCGTIRTLIHCGNVVIEQFGKKILKISYKLKQKSTQWLIHANPTYLPKRNKNIKHCTRIFIEILFIVTKHCKNPKGHF